MKKLIALILLAIVLAGATIWMATRVAGAEREASIATANLDALRDTIVRYQADSTETVTLMAAQRELTQAHLDSLDASLRLAMEGRDQSLRSLQTVRVEFERLRDEYESLDVRPVAASDAAVVDTAEEVAEFWLDGPPIEGSLSVTYRPLVPWSLSTDLAVTPYDMSYTVGCDAMRRAVVNVTTPTWVRATLLPDGVQSPEVCHPLRAPLMAFTWRRSLWAAAGFGLGFVVAHLTDDGFRVATY